MAKLINLPDLFPFAFVDYLGRRAAIVTIHGSPSKLSIKRRLRDWPLVNFHIMERNRAQRHTVVAIYASPSEYFLPPNHAYQPLIINQHTHD